jgi:uroporphyrinogen decarboxylase
MTTKAERLQSAINGDVADRAPVALWRHFPVDDQDPIQLAERTLEFQARYDFDLIKVTPASSFCIKDWGVEDEWNGVAEGTRDYVKRVVSSMDDWRRLPALNPEEGALGAQLACLKHIKNNQVDDTPFIQTIFSPLAQAKNLSGNAELMRSIRRDPESVKAALRVITETTIAFIQSAKAHGIAGIFYAIQHASYDHFDRDSYAQFGEPFDQQILEAANDLWLNVLHLHGVEIMFELAGSYPVHVVNWHDRETSPKLREGREVVKGAVCGGLQRWNTLVIGTPETVQAEAQNSLQSTDGGRGHILGTGCVVPINAPRGNLIAAREAVE